VMALGDLRAAEATGDLVSLRATSDEPVLRYLAARELVSIGGTPAGPAFATGSGRAALRHRRHPRAQRRARHISPALHHLASMGSLRPVDRRHGKL